MTTHKDQKANSLLEAAKHAFRAGKRIEARKFATEAVRLQPRLEDAWLLLAGLASPRASIEYLQKALQINPNSELARKGLQWAVTRMRKEKSHPGELNKGVFETSQPLNNKIADSSLRIGANETVSTFRKTINSAVVESQTQVVKTIKDDEKKERKSKTKTQKNNRWLAIPISAVVFILLIVLVFFMLPRLVVSASSASSAQRPAGLLLKPSLTPTPTITPTPTETPLPTPTDTPTPQPSSTPLPPPTETPRPSTYVFPGELDDDRWIDVDLSEQMVYAYEGNVLVSSFLVSTGTYLHPTVTGQYHIYVKYLYDDMAGPGYYLPDVPFTMYFYQGYSFHGTYWHSNFGTPMSHGCINMYTPDAGWLYNWASVGTLVNVHY